MTTYNETQHQRRVSDMITDVADTETQIEMRAVADQYRRIRQSLLVALSEIRKLDEEYGHDHEQIGDLRQMLITLRLEELAMHKMCADLFDDAEQAV